MKKTFFGAVLFMVVFVVGSFAQPYAPLREGEPGVHRGKASRYWDGCKASCSFIRKSTHLLGACKNCDVDNNEIPVVDQPTDNNSCQMMAGAAPYAYTCWDQIPFRDPDEPNLAYGFAATSGMDGDKCGKCFQLQFLDVRGDGYNPIATHAAINGKTLIVMASNIGYDVAPGQFDLLIPGGGLGIFDGFSAQIGVNPLELGARGGGLLNDCEVELNYGIGKTVEDFQECLRNKCNAVFSRDPKHALLLEGCLFYANWFMAANNPAILSKELDKCPDVLLDRYFEGSGGNNPTPGSGYISPPRKTIITIQANRGNGDMTSLSQGNPQTYNIADIPGDGEYTVTFGLASEQAINFTVVVNGQNAGNISLPNGTGSWSDVSPITLDSKVNLKAGDNTITMDCQTGGNITYIRLVNEPEAVSVRHNTAKTAKPSMSNVTLRPGVNGFTAMLPASHGYTSYRLFDLRGREIRRGHVDEGMADLWFNNIRNGVVFLKLDGKNTSTVLRATTIR